MLVKKQGMTILELLVALTIFASAFVYISQMLRFHLKQQKKISHNIEISRTKENVFELLRQDLKGVVFFYDINFHLLEFFPVSSDSPQEFTSDEITPPPPPVNIMESRFDFSGQKNKLRFVSLVMVSSGSDNPPRPQLRKVEYFLRSCKKIQTGESSQCLTRGVSRDWKDIEDVKNQEVVNLLEDVKRIEFAYFDEDWRGEWSFSNRWKAAAKKPRARSSLLPGLVKLEIEGETEKPLKASYSFAISHPFLRSHIPGRISALAFLDVGRTEPKNTLEDPSENPSLKKSQQK